MSNYLSVLSLAVTVLALVITLLTLYVAWRIPHQIMISQRYAELLTEYRSIEMGEAIFSIIKFFVHDCANKMDVIEKNYVEHYNKEICKKHPKRSLHFKRRLVDHFFWLLGDLMYNPDYPLHLPHKQVRRDFSKNEHYLLHILHHMNKAASSKECRLDPSLIDKCSCGCHPSGNSPMDKYRNKLYEESSHWE